MFKRVLIVGWGIFFVGMLLALALPRQVLRYGALPTIVLGILLGPVTFVYGLVWVVRQRINQRRERLLQPTISRTIGKDGTKLLQNNRINIELPRGWSARILVGSWVLFFIGMLLAFLAPRSMAGNLINPLLILTILVVLGSLAYAAAGTVKQLYRYWRRKGE
jgi:hypothetical protein